MGFVLDLTRGRCLPLAGEPVPLRHKSFELLRLFVKNAGRLLDRDTINQAIWSDVIVTDDSMTQCVRDIRRALGDEAQRHRQDSAAARLPFTAEGHRQPKPARAVASRLPLPEQAVDRGVALPEHERRSASRSILPTVSSRTSSPHFRALRSLFVIARNSASPTRAGQST